MTLTYIDYASTYFEHQMLTKIHGEPCFIALQRLKNQIKANLNSINTELGRVNNGHLGLGLTTVEYVLVPAIACTRPVHLGAVGLVEATQHETVRLRDDYARAIRLFREVMDVEKEIVKQTVQVIDEIYIKSLRSYNTSTINRHVAEIWIYLSLYMCCTLVLPFLILFKK